MTTTKTTTPIDPRERSIALAEARGHTACSWAARLLGTIEHETTGALVVAAWFVASATSDDDYLVTYKTETDDARCSCKSAQFNHACWHRGLAIIKGRSLATLCTPAGREAEERHAAQDRIDEENARCLGF